MATDEQLDREWKPQGNRPQSTMARSFSLALNDLFKIDNSIADLDAAVTEKKDKITSAQSELEALEARIKAMEERLAASSPSSGRSPGRSSPHQRAPISPNTFADAQSRREQATSPLAGQFGNSVRSRPTTGRSDKGQNVTQQTPGAGPPTPSTSEGEESEREYVVVRRADTTEDGDAETKDA